MRGDGKQPKACNVFVYELARKFWCPCVEVERKEGGFPRDATHFNARVGTRCPFVRCGIADMIHSMHDTICAIVA